MPTKTPTDPAKRAEILKKLETERHGRHVFRLLGQLTPEITEIEARVIRQKRKDGQLP